MARMASFRRTLIRPQFECVFIFRSCFLCVVGRTLCVPFVNSITIARTRRKCGIYVVVASLDLDDNSWRVELTLGPNFDSNFRIEFKCGTLSLRCTRECLLHKLIAHRLIPIIASFRISFKQHRMAITESILCMCIDHGPSWHDGGMTNINIVRGGRYLISSHDAIDIDEDLLYHLSATQFHSNRSLFALIIACIPHYFGSYLVLIIFCLFCRASHSLTIITIQPTTHTLNKKSTGFLSMRPHQNKKKQRKKAQTNAATAGAHSSHRQMANARTWICSNEMREEEKITFARAVQLNWITSN